jgi:hypothetical protein
MNSPAINLVRRPDARPAAPRTWIDCRLRKPTDADMPVIVYVGDRDPDGVPPRRVLVAYSVDTFRSNPKFPFEMLYWMPGTGILPQPPGE